MSEHPREQIPLPLPWRLSRELRLPRPPWWLVLTLIGLVLLAAAPLIWLLATRGRPFSSPRVDWIQDMGVQPRNGPQSKSVLFNDQRSMRLPVSGTVAQGALQHDPHFFAGYETKVSAEGAPPELKFFDDFPEQIQQWGMELARSRGKERFGIYCTPCHGALGAGDGLVSLRAKALGESKWVTPTHLMTQTIRDKPNGYLFSVVSRGVRNMPSYAIQISPEDRWAIVAYLRQLQAEQPVATEPASTTATAQVPSAVKPDLSPTESKQ